MPDGGLSARSGPPAGPPATGTAAAAAAARSLRVRCLTWNMHGAPAPPDISPLLSLPPPLDAAAVDLLAVGTQECERPLSSSLLSPRKARWEAALSAALGARYYAVAQCTLGATHLALYARRELRACIRGVAAAAVPCGGLLPPALARGGAAAGVGALPTKGAAAVACTVGMTSLLFICAHLAAAPQAVRARNAGAAHVHQRLLARLAPPPRRALSGAARAPADGATHGGSRADCSSAALMPVAGGDASAAASVASAATTADGWCSSGGLPASPLRRDVRGGSGDAAVLLLPPLRRSTSTGSSTSGEGVMAAPSSFDGTFLMGDLNYRLEGCSREAADAALAAGDVQSLLDLDQLTRERRAGRVLPGFEEGVIAFLPTYKVDAGSSPPRYDTSAKRRVPAWTDRILWRAKPMADAADGGTATAAAIRLDFYTSIPAMLGSDHLPVTAGFTVALRHAAAHSFPAAAVRLLGESSTGNPAVSAAAAAPAPHVRLEASAPPHRRDSAVRRILRYCCGSRAMRRATVAPASLLLPRLAEA